MNATYDLETEQGRILTYEVDFDCSRGLPANRVDPGEPASVAWYNPQLVAIDGEPYDLHWSWDAIAELYFWQRVNRPTFYHHEQIEKACLRAMETSL